MVETTTSDFMYGEHHILPGLTYEFDGVNRTNVIHTQSIDSVECIMGNISRSLATYNHVTGICTYLVLAEDLDMRKMTKDYYSTVYIPKIGEPIYCCFLFIAF